MNASYWLSAFIGLLLIALFFAWICLQTYRSARACDAICEEMEPESAHKLGRVIARLDRILAWSGSLSGACLIGSLLNLRAYLMIR